jgi:hypothetical protein
MDFLSSFNRTDFFGKDPVSIFLGQVEDVNDPKMSGRVKVRVVGIHPKDKTGEDSLKTKDLPWAHVVMPTTHAQQARVGGKHGLLPGSWVIGFHMDGQEFQMPFVIGSFNFTAKSVDSNNRKSPVGQDGTLSDADPTFTKLIAGSSQFPNSGRNTTKEPGGILFGDPSDPAGDTVLSEADATKCGGEKVLISVADVNRQDKYTKAGNPSGQVKKVTKADGACGSTKNAKEDVKKEMEEQLPSATDRFLYGDVVWNNITGNFINLNGIINNLACTLASYFIQAIMSKKAEEEEKNREDRKKGNKEANDRDGKLVEETDDSQQAKDDVFHALLATTLIDILCSLLQQLLRDIDKNAGPKGIVNPGADCIAEQITNNVESIVDKAIKEAKTSASNFDISSIISLASSLLGFIKFTEEEKYTTKEPHNKAGKQSQDKKNKEDRCNKERVYNTELGSLPSIGFNFGSFGGGTGFSSNFGGTRNASTGEVNTVPCRDSETPDEENGSGAEILPVPLPADIQGPCARNFELGVPNTLVILNPGRGYFYYDEIQNKVNFPIIYIRNYRGTPIPVVDRTTGEIVLVVTSCSSFDPDDPSSPVTVIPASPIENEGIFSDDPNFNVRLNGFFIQNTGFNYCEPVIDIIDRDTGAVNGKARIEVVEGRVVNIEVIEKGDNFKRIPEIIITDNGSKCNGLIGSGAVVYPIMELVPRDDERILTLERDVIFRLSPTLENGIFDKDGNKVGELQ